MAVDIEAVLLERDLVTRHTDHACDQPLASGLGVQHHDIAALRIGAVQQREMGERHAPIVGGLVDHDAVADADGRLHRTGGEGALLQRPRDRKGGGVATAP
jgi:hypothetical protein